MAWQVDAAGSDQPATDAPSVSGGLDERLF